MTPPALRALAATSVLAIAGVLLAAAPASAGVVDGSLNNAHALDHANLLGAMLGSRIDDGSSSLTVLVWAGA